MGKIGVGRRTIFRSCGGGVNDQRKNFDEVLEPNPPMN
jgi:hypothetical protein